MKFRTNVMGWVAGAILAVALVAMYPVAMAAVATPDAGAWMPHMLIGASDPSTWLSAGGIGAAGLVNLKELRDKRGTAIAAARAIVDKAETEKRAMTAEEESNYKKAFDEATELRGRIDREEKLQEEERAAAEEALKSKGKRTDVSDPEKRSRRDTDEYRTAFTKFLVGGRSALTDAEQRALQSDNDATGGYMVAPEMFVNTLIKAVDDMVFIRQRATKFTLPGAQSMGAASLDADPADAAWTSELATGNEDSSMTFGKRELHPRPLAKRIKVSNRLLQLTPGIESLVRARLAYKFGITQEKAFMTGSGANQPLGVFTASANGIPTSRDVATGNGTTAPTFDGLISAKFGLKGAYWGKAEWIFHRDVLAVVSKLKDGNGQYLWRESVRAGEPDRILQLPVNMSEYAPNTLTTGQYVGILGDFSNYWIADALDMAIQRLVELYAEANQTGFIGRLETDGMPVLGEAFVRVKLG
jgi:HK97 family phage major capsid protein